MAGQRIELMELRKLLQLKQNRSEWMFGVADPFWHPELVSQRNYFDKFGVRKNTVSLNLKWGFQYIFGRFSMDYYLGLGLKYRDVRHFDRMDPTDEMESTRHPNIHYISNREAAHWTVSIPMNFKLGWAF